MNTPLIVVSKNDRRLDYFEGDDLVRSFEVVLGFDPIGDKEMEGDGRTPEGEFYIFVKNPESKYHLSLGISYPSVEDAERGMRDGLITQEEHDEIVGAIEVKGRPPQRTRLGGEIYIHGESGDKPTTSGCIRIKNDEIEWLYERAVVGTAVVINR